MSNLLIHPQFSYAHVTLTVCTQADLKRRCACCNVCRAAGGEARRGEARPGLRYGYIGARTDTTQQSGQTPYKEVEIKNITVYVSGYTEIDTTGMLSPPTVWPFSVAAVINSNVFYFYFLIWSLSRLLCCVGFGFSVAAATDLAHTRLTLARLTSPLRCVTDLIYCLSLDWICAVKCLLLAILLHSSHSR
jgi:hypothetical protein